MARTRVGPRLVSRKGPRKNLQAKANHPNRPPSTQNSSAPRARRRKRSGSMLDYYIYYNNMGINWVFSESATRDPQLPEKCGSSDPKVAVRSRVPGDCVRSHSGPGHEVPGSSAACPPGGDRGIYGEGVH